MKKIKKDLEMDFMISQKWFHENHIVLNPGKCHYIVIGYNDPSHNIMLNNHETASSNEEKRLRILLGSKSNFDAHIKSLSKKTSQKLITLPKMNPYLAQIRKSCY